MCRTGEFPLLTGTGSSVTIVVVNKTTTVRPEAPMPDLLAALHQLGFTDYEARLYLELIQRPGLTGYELAKALGLPRANVYAALQSLVMKGGARRMPGEPVRHAAVDFEELAAAKSRQFQASLDFLRTNLPKPVEAAEAILVLSGDAAIAGKLANMAESAERTIYLDLWAEEIEALRPILLDAAKRGVRIVLIAAGPADLPGATLYRHGRDEEWAARHGRPLRMVVDSYRAMAGSAGRGAEARALCSADPAFVDLVREALIHDIILARVRELSRAEGDTSNALAELLQGGWGP